MVPETMYRLNHVSKVYGEIKAISPLSLSIEKGDIVAIIGPSGAGKTTLLNILANLIQPTTGNIIIDGKESIGYRSGKELSRKIGIIHQQFDLVRSLPVIHNVLAGRLGEWGFFKSLWSLLFPQDKKLVVDSLKRVGLEDKLYERTSKLSGGEQQRVALARLIVQHPEAILADEPVSSLDPARAEDIIQMLIQLVKEEKLTLVASLHSVELARKYFNRIIAIRHGELFFDLAPQDINIHLLEKLYQLDGSIGAKEE